MSAQQKTAPSSEVENVKLWDPLLRGFHWALAILVIAAIALAEFGPAQMTLHFYAGYGILGLLGFRVIWGLIGPTPARFSHFIYGPRAIIDYLRHFLKRSPSYWPGHNPMGGIAVFALLGLVGLQAITGLMVDPDDYINIGPLAASVSADIRDLAGWWHDIGALLIKIMVALHIAMILFYKLWKRENLITPMITGWKWVRSKR